MRLIKAFLHTLFFTIYYLDFFKFRQQVNTQYFRRVNKAYDF